MNVIIIVVTIISSVLLGFVALAISFNMQRKFELDYVKSYFYHQIFIFLFGFYGLLGTIVTHYFLIDADIKRETLRLITSFLPFIGVPFMITAWYLFIKISFEIIEREITFKFTIWFFIVLILIFLSFGFFVPYIDYFTTEKNQINTHIFLFFLLIEFLTLVIVFSNYFFYSNRLKDIRKLRFVKRFGVINFLLYAVSFVFLILGDKNFLFIFVYTIIYFSKDIIALLFLYQYLQKNYVHPSNRIHGDSMSIFAEKFGISKRELDIVNEIILGKANKEISERLFISIQTVKDHIHNIYLKTEVKNRVQLINLVRQFEK